MKIKDNSGYIVVHTTLPDKKTSKVMARKLVEEGLVACVNLIPVESIYSWEGRIEDTEEYLLIMKSRSEYYRKIERRIKELHPYEIPEIISYNIDKGHKEYLKWIDDITEGISQEDFSE